MQACSIASQVHQDKLAGVKGAVCMVMLAEGWESQWHDCLGTMYPSQATSALAAFVDKEVDMAPLRELQVPHAAHPAALFATCDLPFPNRLQMSRQGSNAVEHVCALSCRISQFSPQSQPQACACHPCR